MRARIHQHLALVCCADTLFTFDARTQIKCDGDVTMTNFVLHYLHFLNTIDMCFVLPPKTILESYLCSITSKEEEEKTLEQTKRSLTKYEEFREF